MTWLAPHDGGPGRPAAIQDAAIQDAAIQEAAIQDAAIQFCLTIQVLFKVPLQANDRKGGQPAEDGKPGPGCAGSYDPVPTAEDARRPDPVPPCGWPLLRVAIEPSSRHRSEAHGEG